MSRDTTTDLVRPNYQRLRQLVAWSIRANRSVQAELDNAGDRIVAVASKMDSGEVIGPPEATYRVIWHGPWNRMGVIYFDRRMRRLG